MKEEMVQFFINHPYQFGVFCENLLNGKPAFWKGHMLTDKETRKVYSAMRKIFPGRKDG